MLPPKILANRYEVLRPLGRGGMGDVLLVRDQRDGREVALKRLHLKNAEAAARFRDEFATLARIEHPNIVRVFDYGVLSEGAGSGAYFTMEYLEGKPIDEAIGPGDVPALLRASIDIFAGLDALDAAGIVHCDLKPANVMVVREADGSPRACLLDFGFAGRRGEDQAETTAPARAAADLGGESISATRIRGTPGYAAPEVLAGGAFTRSSDAYALGATLYRVLSGRPAFGGANAPAILTAQRRGRPSALPLRAVGAPMAIEAALLTLLSEAPELRQLGANDLREAAKTHSSITELKHGIRARGVGSRGEFIGRIPERQRLRSHLFRRGFQLAILRGGIGSGRTRLAREIAIEAELQGWLVAWIDRETSSESAMQAIRRPDRGEATELGPGILLVLDDVHCWGKDAVDKLNLGELDSPLAILATVDAEIAGEDWTHALLSLREDPDRRDFELLPLSLEEIAHLVTSRLGASSLDSLAAFLQKQVGGNPAPIHQALDMFLSSGALIDDTGRWEFDEQRATKTLTQGLASELEANLAGLDPSARELLLRLTFELPVEARDPGSERVLRLLGWLGPRNERCEIPQPGLSDRLRSHLLAKATSEDLTRLAASIPESFSRSVRGSRMLGELALANGDRARATSLLLNAVRIATNVHDSDAEASAETLIDQLLPSSVTDGSMFIELANREGTLGRNRRAADLLARALSSAEGVSLETRADLALSCAVFLIRIGDFAEALMTLDARNGLFASAAADKVEWSMRRAEALQFLGRTSEATDEYERSMALVPDSDAWRRARIENRLAMMLYLGAEPERGRALLNVALERAQSSSNRGLASVIEGNFGLIARIEGDLTAAELRQRRAIEGQEREGDDHELGIGLANLASTLANGSQWEEFEAIGTRVGGLARARRDPHLLLNLLATRIPAALRRGRISEALKLERSQRVWLPSIRRLEADLHHLTFRSETLRLLGREGAARRILHRVLAPGDGRTLPRYSAYAEAMLGRIDARRGAFDRAVTHLVKAQTIRSGDMEIAAIALVELARLTPRLPDSKEVLVAIEALCGADSDPKFHPGYTLEAKGWRFLRSGEVDTALGSFEAALRIYSELDHRVNQIELARQAGVAISERGRTLDAARLIRGAWTLARGLGLRVWAQRLADDIIEIENREPTRIHSAGSMGIERDTLFRVSEVLNSSLDPTVLLPRALSFVCERMGAERGFILLHDENGDPRPVASYGHIDDESRVSALDLSRTVIRHVSESGRTFRSDDATTDPRLVSTLSVLDLSMRSILCTPLRIGDEGIGTIYLENRAVTGQFDEEQLDLVEAFANVVAVAIQNARLHEQVRRSRDRVVGENLSLRREVRGRFRSSNIVGQSAEIERIHVEIARIAPSRATVLITGESGTGKDLIAKAIHFASPRADRALLSLNCAALPAELIESELFGIEDRVATGVRGRPGIFERADGGTLFLDEIGDMPLSLQAKLLRVLQEREFTRVGGSQQIKVDVRLIAATNQELQDLIAQGKFREDLFYRIQMLPIHLPPLRERKIDVPHLARHFLERFCAENTLPLPRMSAEYQAVLLRSDWPGNVRELQSYIERSAIMSPGPVVEPVVLPTDLEPARTARKRGASAPEEIAEAPNPPRDLRAALEEVERRWIRSALEAVAGNQRRAAFILGVAEPTLRYRMGRLNVPLASGGEKKRSTSGTARRSHGAQKAAKPARQ